MPRHEIETVIQTKVTVVVTATNTDYIIPANENFTLKKLTMTFERGAAVPANEITIELQISDTAGANFARLVPIITNLGQGDVSGDHYFIDFTNEPAVTLPINDPTANFTNMSIKNMSFDEGQVIRIISQGTVGNIGDLIIQMSGVTFFKL